MLCSTKIIAKLLDLEDVIVTNVETISGELRVCLELPRTKHACPACGALTDHVHDYRMQRVKDIPLGRKTLLYLRKRRYRCLCGKRFFEKNSFLPKYHRVTSRLVAAIIGWMPKAIKWSIFCQTDLRTILSSTSHNFHLKLM